MCVKLQYETKEQAREAARLLSIRKKTHANFYLCNECGQYHLSTVRGKPKLPRSVRNEKYPFRHQPPKP